MRIVPGWGQKPDSFCACKKSFTCAKVAESILPTGTQSPNPPMTGGRNWSPTRTALLSSIWWFCASSLQMPHFFPTQVEDRMEFLRGLKAWIFNLPGLKIGKLPTLSSAKICGCGNSLFEISEEPRGSSSSSPNLIDLCGWLSSLINLFWGAPLKSLPFLLNPCPCSCPCPWLYPPWPPEWPPCPKPPQQSASSTCRKVTRLEESARYFAFFFITKYK